MLVLDQRIKTNLSLAVTLIDDFKNTKEILGEVKVKIPKLNYDAKKTLSEYYTFLDLPDNPYTILIESDYYIEKVIENLVIPRNYVYHFLAATGAPIGSLEAVLDSIDGLFEEDVLEFNNGSDPPERRTIKLDPDSLLNKINWTDDPLDGLSFTYDDSHDLIIPIPERYMINVRLIANTSYQFPAGTTLLRGEVLNILGIPIPSVTVELGGKNFKTLSDSKGEFVIYFPSSQQDASFNIILTPPASPPKTVNVNIYKGKVTTSTIIYP